MNDRWGRFAAMVGLSPSGSAVGAFTAITFGPQVGAALRGRHRLRRLDGAHGRRRRPDRHRRGGAQGRFYPVQTIETSKETLEWLQKRMPPGIGS